MCARYTTPKAEMIEEMFRASPVDTRRNVYQPTIFPSFSAPVVFETNSGRKWDLYHWSLQPRHLMGTQENKWATFNARAETILDKITYKKPFLEGRRCVIPATAFVEWTGQKGKKIPWLISDPAATVLPIAGIWDQSNFGLESFTMITTEANPEMTAYHHRMPVILKDWQEWLSLDTTPDQAMEMLKPWPGKLQFLEASKTPS